MQADGNDEARPHVPGWVALIVINLISFGVVAALVGLSVIVDSAFFDLG